MIMIEKRLVGVIMALLLSGCGMFREPCSEITVGEDAGPYQKDGYIGSADIPLPSADSGDSGLFNTLIWCLHRRQSNPGSNFDGDSCSEVDFSGIRYWELSFDKWGSYCRGDMLGGGDMLVCSIFVKDEKVHAVGSVCLD